MLTAIRTFFKIINDILTSAEAASEALRAECEQLSVEHKTDLAKRLAEIEKSKSENK